MGSEDRHGLLFKAVNVLFVQVHVALCGAFKLTKLLVHVIHRVQDSADGPSQVSFAPDEPLICLVHASHLRGGGTGCSSVFSLILPLKT